MKDYRQLFLLFLNSNLNTARSFVIESAWNLDYRSDDWLHKRVGEIQNFQSQRCT